MEIINVEENLTIQGLFDHIIDQYVSQLKDKILKSIEVHCSISKEQTEDEIELECLVSDIINTFEHYLPDFDFSNNPKANDQLKLDILTYILSHISGWTYDTTSIGKKFIRELSDALWYVDKCGPKTFNDRYTIPIEFS
ncbi:953_t:CDS:2 [Funneliformis geosporum]|nr:953_t:CDS:2 [Funneliformis geosporum]